MPPNSLVHVIDDDDAVRESLEFLLRAAKIDVRTYDSATAFLKAMPDGAAGCIVTDVRMPGMSGVDLLRQLKARGSTMPVIVITGHGDIQLAVEAMKIGAADFLEKPFDDEVASRIGQVSARPAGEGCATRDRARGTQQQARQPLRPGARGPGGAGRGKSQQGHRIRSRHQPAHCRNLSRPCHDEDERRQPVRTRSNGAAGRRA